jgi:hypothetical protein
MHGTKSKRGPIKVNEWRHMLLVLCKTNIVVFCLYLKANEAVRALLLAILRIKSITNAIFHDTSRVALGTKEKLLISRSCFSSFILFWREKWGKESCRRSEAVIIDQTQAIIDLSWGTYKVPLNVTCRKVRYKCKTKSEKEWQFKTDAAL